VKKEATPMLRATASKVMWVGRATVFLVGLSVILAAMFGVASTAFGANGGNFILGQNNTASLLTRLTGQVPGGAALQVVNTRTESGSRGLQVTVAEDKPPIVVNATAGKATNLNADELDGKDSTQFADSSHTHSGADIASGTVEADRIEDGQGSNLNADQLDGFDSTQLPHGFYPVEEIFTQASPANGFAAGEAFCDAGDQVVGGGYGDLHPTSAIATDSPTSGASGTQSGWVITWKTADPSTTDTIIVFALCADFGITHT
jgi:hypothetical protein